MSFRPRSKPATTVVEFKDNMVPPQGNIDELTRTHEDRENESRQKIQELSKSLEEERRRNDKLMDKIIGKIDPMESPCPLETQLAVHIEKEAALHKLGLVEKNHHRTKQLIHESAQRSLEDQWLGLKCDEFMESRGRNRE